MRQHSLPILLLCCWWVALIAVGCTVPPKVSETDAGVVDDRGPVLREYPLDDTLRLQHIQVLGTHNSYHIAPEDPIDAWSYTHKPLNEQLGPHGVRQFELDLYWDKDKQRFLVQHIPFLDPLTTCETFQSCLSVMREWSLRHPQHLPIVVMVETKVGSVDEPPAMFSLMEKEILAAWPRSAIVKPDDVQGDAASIQAAVRTNGWPTLGKLRGKIVFFLLTSASRRAAYTSNNTSLRGKLMFAAGPLDSPLTAITNLDNPFDKETIARALKAGVLIRTRADSNPTASKEVNEKRLEAALKSGAQFVSTDFPYPRNDGYIARIPGGTPARCNPILAPPSCTPEALETGNSSP